jgi:hypothetical protein
MLTSPAHCRIVVRDSRGMSSSKFLETLPLQMEIEEQGRQPTTFIGHPIDLAAFLGVLQMFLDLGLPVVALEYGEGIDEDPASGAKRNGQ